MRSILRFVICLLPCTALADRPLTFSSTPPVPPAITTRHLETPSRLDTELALILHEVGGDDLHAFFGFVPQVVVTDGDMPNAFAKAPNRVEISNGLIAMTQNVHELAFVLTHELAHHMLEHSVAYPAFADAPQQLPSTMLHWEHAADTLAIQLLANAGFDTHPASELLERLALHYQRLIPASATSRHLRARSARLQSLLTTASSDLPRD